MDLSKCKNYFVKDGKTYYTGTVIKVNHYGKEVDAVFICMHFREWSYCNVSYWEMVFKYNGTNHFIPESTFWEQYCVCITNAVDSAAKMPQQKYMKDSDIPSLSIGWLWYIFLMAIATIFKDAIGLWILISVVFFSWRANKIKEEGTYIEW